MNFRGHIQTTADDIVEIIQMAQIGEGGSRGWSGRSKTPWRRRSHGWQ
jgi:hypothetical protein